MTKVLTPTERPKKQRDNTKIPPKRKRLHNHCTFGRSAGVPTSLKWNRTGVRKSKRPVAIPQPMQVVHKNFSDFGKTAELGNKVQFNNKVMG